MFKAKVIKDSVGPNGVRLSSVEMTYPRFVHAEVMTHRDRARNAASSRAIPWKRKRSKHAHESDAEYAANMAEGGLGALTEKCMYWQIMANPVIPIKWGAEQKGMQTGDEIAPELREGAERIWLEARDAAVKAADKLSHLGVHKSLCNRLTEPFMWITVLMSATEWNNFFRLRCHSDAEIHFQKIAGMVRDELRASVPQELKAAEWHLPYFDDKQDVPQLKIELAYGVGDGRRIDALTQDEAVAFKRGNEGEDMRVFYKYAKMISSGRCARLSYLTQDGKRSFNEDIALCQRLIDRKDDVLHASPTEHVAEASSRTDLVSGCFRGWKQFRKEFPNENVEGHIATGPVS